MRSRRGLILGWIALGLTWLLSLVPVAVDSGHWVTPVLWLFRGVPLEATYFPTPFKSITQIDITGVSTQTVSVTKANSILFWNGFHGGAGGIDGISYATITNDTTVTTVGGASSVHWKGTLVEFLAPFVKSEGCGTITLGSGVQSNTATITSVNPAKTITASDGFSSTNNVDGNNVAVASVLTNGTTITASSRLAPTAGFSTTAAYCYIEMKL